MISFIFSMVMDFLSSISSIAAREWRDQERVDHPSLGQGHGYIEIKNARTCCIDPAPPSTSEIAVDASKDRQAGFHWLYRAFEPAQV